MTSFGWKRKVGSRVSKTASQTFNAEAKDEEESDNANMDLDWLTMTAKRRKVVPLEDNISKSERLKVEGVTLAETERFWEAMKKWDEALDLVPNNEKVLDMKAQALMAVGEVFPAVQTAEKLVRISPTWWVGYQTLGRALANIGEVRKAMKSFCKAIHLNPAEEELWQEDLLWTKSLLERLQVSKEDADISTSVTKPKSTLTLTELKDNEEDEDETTKSLALFSGNTKAHDGNAEDQNSAKIKNLKRLPGNYVQMRDPS